MYSSDIKLRSVFFQICLATALIILSFDLVYSQSGSESGYIVNLKGDTISGKLIDGGAMKNSRICRFQIEGQGIESFAPFEITEYRFDNGRYYVSKKVSFPGEVKSVFAEYLVKGKKNLYYLRDRKGEHLLIDMNDSILVEIPFESRIESVNNKMYDYKTTRHIGFLETYFSDCPQLFSKIEAIEEPDFDNLTALTKTYHDIVCGENSCIVFKKDQASVKLGIEPRVEFTNLFEKSSVFRRQFGGMVTLWLPESNRNLYAKAGFFYSEKSSDNQYYYKIPLRFEYLFTDWVIRPKLNAGCNVYSIRNKEFSEGIGVSLVAGGGFLARLNNHFFISVDCENDVLFLNYETGFLNSFTFGGGLFFQF